MEEWEEIWNIGIVEEWKVGRLSYFESCKQAGHIEEDEYEKLDQLHYKVENALTKLIEPLQKKQVLGDWKDTSIPVF